MEMKELDKKLNELVDFDVEHFGKFNSIDEIENFEKEIDFKFPEDYKHFLFTYCDCVFHMNTMFQLPEVSSITDSKGQYMTGAFLGTAIKSKIGNLYFSLKDDYIEIGGAGGYSLFMGMRGEKYGKIYLFAFDEDYKDGTSYFPVADSFTELVMNTVFVDE